MVGALVGEGVDGVQESCRQCPAVTLSCAYIELGIYQTFLAGPLDFDTRRFDCMQLVAFLQKVTIRQMIQVGKH